MKLQSVTYHRNGVCGTGFYAADFTDDGTAYTGIVTADLVEAKRYGTPLETDPFYAVLQQGDSTTTWRGDCFVDDLVKAINAYLSQVDMERRA